MKNKISVIITWDVDPDRWTTLDRRREALSMSINLCEEFGIRSTYFITANFAHEYADLIQKMQLIGQEIGCHGLTHTDEEDYNKMPVEIQEAYIREATEKLEAVTGEPVLAFRSPRVKTSGSTLTLLSKFGYLADSSVCSQRVDFLSSNLINPGWLTAPRRPYHPSNKNAFRKGSLPVWEIPVSALMIPFISGSLSVFGLRFMKALFRLLSLEASRTGKPIVFLAHPSEFIGSNRRGGRNIQRQFSLSAIKTHGFLIRNTFFRLNGDAMVQATRSLFDYIASHSGVSFVTCREYIDKLRVVSTI